MCGIAGCFLKKPSDISYKNVNVLLRSIRRRGPDDEGICLISRQNKSKKMYSTDNTIQSIASNLDNINNPLSIIESDLALAHTRYAIIDLSAGGHQPFVSSDESIVAIFNGEIYNYIEIRNELSNLGVQFRTSSDTEVLVEGYRIWKNHVWSKLNGFWAVALYDFSRNIIILSRDRLGIAPFYYRECPEGFYFSSSIQSLIDLYPNLTDLDTKRIFEFIRTSIKDFDNSTFYRQVKTIPPATAVVFPSNVYNLQGANLYRYWHMPKARLTEKDITFDDAVRQFRETFFSAVELRLRADVKVAFELSGGLDSSSIVAVAAMLRNNDITTYTIKVPEDNEEPYARSILKKYPIDYRVLSDPEDNFMRESKTFSRIMEEPYHSPNIFTHFKMRQLMKNQGVSVVLAGAGGDEVLAGYEYAFWPRVFKELTRNGHFWRAIHYELARRFMTLERVKGTIRNSGEDLLRLAQVFIKKISKDRMTKHNQSVGEHSAFFYQQEYRRLSFHKQAIYHFRIANIPYYLQSNDHFTMAIPLEHRFPFFDYRIVELGLQLPPTYLFRNGWTKYILRKAMGPYLPKEILWRKDKMGFPFAYKRFLTVNRSEFKEKVQALHDINMPFQSFWDYNYLLGTNPLELWRLCSTALWIEGIKSQIS